MQVDERHLLLHLPCSNVVGPAPTSTRTRAGQPAGLHTPKHSHSNIHGSLHTACFQDSDQRGGCRPVPLQGNGERLPPAAAAAAAAASGPIHEISLNPTPQATKSDQSRAKLAKYRFGERQLKAWEPAGCRRCGAPSSGRSQRRPPSARMSAASLLAGRCARHIIHARDCLCNRSRSVPAPGLE